MMLILIYACVILNIAPFAYPFVFHRLIPSLIAYLIVFCVHVIFFLLLRKFIKSNAISPKTKTVVLSTSVPMIVLTDVFAGFFMSLQSLLWAIVGICIIVGYLNKMPALSKTASKRLIIVLAILNLVTYLLAELVWPVANVFGLLILLSNILLLPAFFCAYVKRFAKSAEVPTKQKKIVIWSCVLGMIAVDILVCIIKFQGILVYYLPAKGVWYLICGIWTLLSYYQDRPSKKKMAVKALTWFFATISLLLNALLFFPSAAWYELIQYEVLLIIPFLFAFISICSYLIGKIASDSHTVATLVVWGVAIFASIVSLCLCFFDEGGLDLVVPGIPVAGIMFGFSIIDVLRKKRRNA